MSIKKLNLITLSILLLANISHAEEIKKRMAGSYSINRSDTYASPTATEPAKVTEGQYTGSRMVLPPNSPVTTNNTARLNTIEVKYQVYSQYPDFIPMAENPSANSQKISTAAPTNYMKQGLLEWKKTSGSATINPALCDNITNSTDEKCDNASGEGKIRIKKDVYDTRFENNDIWNSPTLFQAAVTADDGLKCLVSGRLGNGSICGFSRMNIPSLMGLTNAKEGVLTYTGRWEVVLDETNNTPMPKATTADGIDFGKIIESYRGVNYNVCRGMDFINEIKINYIVRRPVFKIKFKYNTQNRGVDYTFDSSEAFKWDIAEGVKLPSPSVYRTDSRNPHNVIGHTTTGGSGGYPNYQSCESTPQRDNRRNYTFDNSKTAFARSTYELIRAPNDPAEPFVTLNTQLKQGIFILDPTVLQTETKAAKTIYRTIPGTEFADPKSSWAHRVKMYFDNNTGRAVEGISCSLPGQCNGTLRNSAPWPQKLSDGNDSMIARPPIFHEAQMRSTHFACDEINEPEMMALEARERDYKRTETRPGGAAGREGAMPKHPGQGVKFVSAGRWLEPSPVGPYLYGPFVEPDYPDPLNGGRPDPESFTPGSVLGHKVGHRGGDLSRGDTFVDTQIQRQARTDIGKRHEDLCQASSVFWKYKQSKWKWMVAGYGAPYNDEGDDADTPVIKPSGPAPQWDAVATSFKTCSELEECSATAEFEFPDYDDKGRQIGTHMEPRCVSSRKAQCAATWQWQLNQSYVAQNERLSYKGLFWNACAETCEIEGSTTRVCHRPWAYGSGTSSGGNSGSGGSGGSGSTGSSGSTASYQIIEKSDNYVGANGNIKYDFFAPDDYLTKDYPVIVSIHGGGWYMGSNNDMLLLNKHMAKRGYKVFAPEYTLDRQMPSQMNDISAFSQWLISKKDTFKINTAPISIAGGSAGGHLALFEASKNNINFKCVYDVAGPVDLNTVVSDLESVDFLGDTNHKNTMKQYLSDILNTVAPTTQQKTNASINGNINAEKIYVLHNNNDMLVPFKQSQKLATLAGGKVIMIPLEFSRNPPTYDGFHNLGADNTITMIPAFDNYIADNCK